MFLQMQSVELVSFETINEISYDNRHQQDITQLCLMPFKLITIILAFYSHTSYIVILYSLIIGL